MKLFEADETDIPVFPVLYKKTSSGSLQYWKVEVVYHNYGPMCIDPTRYKARKEVEIIYEYGQLNTDKPQITNDFIKSGKNIGKANETSIVEQGILEAKAKWEKQKKKGYVESIKDAEAGKLDDLIEGGIAPMLAHKFSKHSAKINFPAYAQPKLDGHRCIAIVDEHGKCQLWSRTRKRITSMVHIEKEIENLGYKSIILDGELYNHDYKSRFDELTSAIRQQEPPEDYDIIQYHIYDCINDDAFENRHKFLKKLIPKNNRYLKPVETILVDDEAVNLDYFKDCLSRGYEGSMIRNIDSPYEIDYRSYSLQKVKKFEEAEFNIVGIQEGIGKLRGHVGAFICVTPHGNKFNAKTKGKQSKLKEYFENHNLWKNKKLTVQYQGWTTKENVPRFSVGVRIREDI